MGEVVQLVPRATDFEASRTSAILYEAAMCFCTGRRSTVRGAIHDATRYLCTLHEDWQGYTEFLRTDTVFKTLFGNADDHFTLRHSSRGGQFMDKRDKEALLMMLCMAYEYVVQEMRGERYYLETYTNFYASEMGIAMSAVWAASAPE